MIDEGVFEVVEKSKGRQLWTHEKKNTYIDEDKGSILTQFDDKRLRKLTITSKYPGKDEEKKDFTLKAQDVVEGAKIYVLQSKTTKATLLIMSEDKISSLPDLQKKIKEQTQDGSIPCYYDKESKVLVVYLSQETIKENVHHGVHGGSHRDTFKGVILARALGKAVEETGNTVSIDLPSELEDSNIISLDMYYKKGFLIMNYDDKNVNPTLAEYLRELDIKSIREYVHLIKDAGQTITVSEMLEALQNKPIDTDTLRDMVLDTLRSIWYRAYLNEDDTNLVFSSGIFTGESTDQRSHNCYRSKEDIKTIDVFVDLLNHSETMPVSIMVYERIENRTGKHNYLMVIGSSHPDASNYRNLAGIKGVLGHKRALGVAELDGNIKINLTKLTGGYIDTDTDTLPINLTITGVKTKDQSISPHKSDKYVETREGVDELIKRISKDYPLGKDNTLSIEVDIK